MEFEQYDIPESVRHCPFTEVFDFVVDRMCEFAGSIHRQACCAADADDNGAFWPARHCSMHLIDCNSARGLTGLSRQADASCTLVQIGHGHAACSPCETGQ